MIVAINAGSGTLALAAFGASLQPDGTLEVSKAPIWRAKVIRYKDPQKLTVKARDHSIEMEIQGSDVGSAVRSSLEQLWRGKCAVIADRSEVVGVGHRIVHGGPSISESASITTEVRQAIEDACSLAPLHNPVGLEALDVASDLLGDAHHVAVFDTTFHHDLPLAAKTYAIPARWQTGEVRRYGFHGISHEDVAHRACEELGVSIGDSGLITVHLGGGCSATAVRDGRSVDTTMGFTPNEGMVMAARSGSIDAGLVTYLQRRHELTADDIDSALNRESGLLGLTGDETGDISAVRDRAESGDKQARLALEVYVHRVQREIAAMRVSLDQFDALVFTGGAVEDEPWLVTLICEGLGFLGIESSDDPAGSSSRVLTITANEEQAIAGIVAGLVPKAPRAPNAP